jgi:hypothetical protein
MIPSVPRTGTPSVRAQRRASASSRRASAALHAEGDGNRPGLARAQAPLQDRHGDRAGPDPHPPTALQRLPRRVGWRTGQHFGRHGLGHQQLRSRLFQQVQAARLRQDDDRRGVGDPDPTHGTLPPRPPRVRTGTARRPGGPRHR